ncbi:unnamed protein product [Choristocarpus tenellus]
MILTMAALLSLPLAGVAYAPTSSFQVGGRLTPPCTRLTMRNDYSFETDNAFMEEMKATAKAIASPGRGILASDESNATTGKRLATIGLSNTEENRRRWRELMYTTPGLGQYISGAIIFDDILSMSDSNGKPFVEVLREQSIIPGIKADTGMMALPFSGGETATQGLDNLGEKCKRWYEQGARFAKWRTVIRVDESDYPTDKAVWENCHALARYAQIAQANGLVPIVEPEVTLGEGDYGIERTAFVSERVNSQVFRWLNEYNVCLDAILLKPNMILPGLDAPVADPETVAKYTLQVMKRTIPPAVPGIHFLSGGMSEQESTENLQKLNELYPGAPWSLTFSYGRALQTSTMNIWAGKDENYEEAQAMLLSLAKVNSEAQRGEYQGPHPSRFGGRNVQVLRLGGPGK